MFQYNVCVTEASKHQLHWWPQLQRYKACIEFLHFLSSLRTTNLQKFPSLFAVKLMSYFILDASLHACYLLSSKLSLLIDVSVLDFEVLVLPGEGCVKQKYWFCIFKSTALCECHFTFIQVWIMDFSLSLTCSLHFSQYWDKGIHKSLEYQKINSYAKST